MSKPTGTLSRDYAATAETLSAILKKEIISLVTHAKDI
jgi:hypothetical protein